MASVGVFTIPQSEVSSLIEKLSDDDFYFICSKIDQIKFGRSKQSLISLGLWETGRLFNEEYEIRWKINNGNGRFTVLTEKDRLPQMPNEIKYEQDDNSWITDETEIILWGEYKNYSPNAKGFVEVRTPIFMEYPDPKNKQWENNDKAMIKCVNYLKDGIVLFTRFKEVANA